MIYFIVYSVIGFLVWLYFIINDARTFGEITLKDIFCVLPASILWPLTFLLHSIIAVNWAVKHSAEIILWRKK